MLKEADHNQELDQRPKYDIIWTLDKICAWNCSFCCVDALYVNRKGEDVSITANSQNFTFPYRSGDENIYSQAAKFLHNQGIGLSVEQKIQAVENLRGIDPKIDFSGGDLLLLPENLQVIKRASELFGKDNISITATGVGMKIGHIEDYLDYIGEVEFTYDNFQNGYEYRQSGYNSTNLDTAIKLCRGRVKLKAQIPLTQMNTDEESIKFLYANLHEAGVDSVLLMRTFPVGRGASLEVPGLASDEYKKIISNFRALAQNLKTPKVKVQCALKNLFPDQTTTNPCGFLKSSLGVTDKGILIASPWAYNEKGGTIDADFEIGDLTKTRFMDLMMQPKIQAMVTRVDENYGHCKMFSYLNDPARQFESIFLNTDPLYINK